MEIQDVELAEAVQMLLHVPIERQAGVAKVGGEPLEVVGDVAGFKDAGGGG